MYTLRIAISKYILYIHFIQTTGFAAVNCSPPRQPEDKRLAPPARPTISADSFNSASRATTAEDEMEITHNNHQYKVTPMANGTLWRLTLVDSPRESVVLNRDQMVIAGLGHVIEKSIVDLNKVRAAQNKIVIARFLGDELMWTKAVEEYRQATGAQS